MDNNVLKLALATVRTAGYRVSKPRAPKAKYRPPPVFVARFADGQVTRMSCYCLSDEALDWGRGQRLSIAAWEQRQRWPDESIAPPIIECWFERDGERLGEPLKAAA